MRLGELKGGDPRRAQTRCQVGWHPGDLKTILAIDVSAVTLHGVQAVEARPARGAGAQPAERAAASDLQRCSRREGSGGGSGRLKCPSRKATAACASRIRMQNTRAGRPLRQRFGYLVAVQGARLVAPGSRHSGDLYLRVVLDAPAAQRALTPPLDCLCHLWLGPHWLLLSSSRGRRFAFAGAGAALLLMGRCSPSCGLRHRNRRGTGRWAAQAGGRQAGSRRHPPAAGRQRVPRTCTVVFAGPTVQAASHLLIASAPSASTQPRTSQSIREERPALARRRPSAIGRTKYFTVRFKGADRSKPAINATYMYCTGGGTGGSGTHLVALIIGILCNAPGSRHLSRGLKLDTQGCKRS